MTDLGSSSQDYLKDDDYFMALAGLAAMRSKDPNNKVGACIIDSDQNVVSIGYVDVCHAIISAKANVADLKTCTIYINAYPCVECAKAIVQSGIKKVVYLQHGQKKRKETAPGKIFKAYTPSNRKITVNLEG
ncbi:deoxycytidylate deaminase-like isoform X2 [Rhynchophorus ferrugineus]|uniref:deoxycytidylate deaminase-like isoform X2 n=1 Tax=Rhynchophorus ferrugineus TaxID=354439 RepID=UPI003FCE5178